MSGGQCAQSALAHRGAQQFGQLLRGLSGRYRLPDRGRSRGTGPARMLARREGQHSRVDKDEDRWRPVSRRCGAPGLDDYRWPRAVVQLASTMRNRGQPAESVELLRPEFARGDDPHFRAACAAFLSLALVDCGRSTEAVATALHGLVPLLNDYGRSVSHYASELSQRANGVHSQPVP